MEIIKKDSTYPQKKEAEMEIPKFHPDIQKIMEIPIKIDPWTYNQIGKRNDGPFKDNYQRLEIRECGEKMVDINLLGLSGEDYYFSKFANRKDILTKKWISKKVFLRKTHVERLVKADKYFKKRGLFLHIVSGWRHPELQKIIKEDYAKKFGCEKADRVFASTDRKVPATHSTGGSFDIELRDLTRKEKIGMDVYYKNEKIPSLYWAEELFNEDKLDSINKEIVKRRRILYHGLCTEKVIFEKNEDTFTAHPGEYWHYGDGDTLSAYLKKESFIRYGIIYP
ncbi:MAG: hypothetical protein US30_C0001G0007 [Candidatus Moranbacteria bacterium GW2011_GWF2_36_839]|nr:MAG: hypothetical protein US27_C0001G0007 [Candidatus Moranbacteria bacterium GW2011_GWF1_36_78]KKQ17673.1 MAG: hypothetical protein US30_C0001G0007 [Candidatus Moranbacteria bacterium GW2011_GWF2_36_839]HAT73376.1 hypothetical protein [Candidatus Moranbacteria bacterium]HBY10739.1 hypothetical protein [Candidatus Moranbacteria bacterium]